MSKDKFDGLCYLASPYAHPDPLIKYERYLSACRATGKLLREGFHVYSPIVHNHPVAEITTLSTNLDFWLEFDLKILATCKRLYVLEIRGWDESKGLAKEVNFAQRNNIDIQRLNEYWWDVKDPKEKPSLDYALDRALRWSDSTFKESTTHSRAAYLLREAQELSKDPYNASEMADVLFLLNHLAKGFGGPNVDLARAVLDKLVVNEQRQWGEPDSEGVVEHVR